MISLNIWATIEFVMLQQNELVPRVFSATMFYCQIMCVLSCERVIPKFQSSENNLGSTKQFSINFKKNGFRNSKNTAWFFLLKLHPGGLKKIMCACVLYFVYYPQKHLFKTTNTFHSILNRQTLVILLFCPDWRRNQWLRGWACTFISNCRFRN